MYSEHKEQLPESEVAAMDGILYRFRPGSIDAIARSRNLHTEKQLAMYLGVRLEDMPALRKGGLVSPEVALRVAAMQGDEFYIGAYFDELPQQERVSA